LVATACAATGCISATARVHAGPTVTSEGEVDVQGGISLGFGYSLTDHSAVNLSVRGSSGSRNAVELGESIEYVAVPDEDAGYRGGLTFGVPLVGDDGVVFATAGMLVPLSHTEKSGGHEKSFQTSTTKVLAIGLSGRAGLMIPFEPADERDPNENTRAAFGADVSLEWHVFSRMR
jgi:hypothetical protein